jgi:hypothetical protein
LDDGAAVEVACGAADQVDRCAAGVEVRRDQQSLLFERAQLLCQAAVHRAVYQPADLLGRARLVQTRR